MTDPTPHPNPELCQFIEDVVWKSDREYFDARPGRSYRIRPAWDAEIRDHDLISGDPPMPLRPGSCWWVAVFQGLPGVRARVIFQGSHQLDIDPPEQQARSTFKTCERQQPKIALLAKALRKMRRDPKFNPPKTP